MRAWNPTSLMVGAPIPALDFPRTRFLPHEINQPYKYWIDSMKHLLALLVLSFAALNVQAQEDAIAEAVVENPEASGIATPIGSDSVRPLTVAVELMGNTIIAGTLVDNAQITVKTAFGEAKIPSTEVAGIRLASKEDSTTTIIMLNGDSITGATDMKVVTVDTEWGTAKINGASVQSLLFVPNLKWNPVQSINGRRWSLVDASAAPAPQTPAVNSQQLPSAGRPSNTVQPSNRVIFPN